MKKDDKVSKDYLVKKMVHYLDQGDEIMADRFQEKYLPLVEGLDHIELSKLILKARRKSKKAKENKELEKKE